MHIGIVNGMNEEIDTENNKQDSLKSGLKYDKDQGARGATLNEANLQGRPRGDCPEIVNLRPTYSDSDSDESLKHGKRVEKKLTYLSEEYCLL